MKPIVATKGKWTQLSYELPHRVHDSSIYPVKAPNGSTIILYGYDTGVGIMWRGGRPLKKTGPPPKQPPKPAKVNGTNNDAIMIIDSDDDEPAKPATQPSVPKAEFEADDEELDPDQPYPSVIQHVRLFLNTAVLHIAVPQMVFTVACADSTVRVITLSLQPPPDAAKERPLSVKSQFGEDIVKIHGHQSIPRGITMTWTAKGEPSLRDEPADDMDVDGDDTSATPGRRRRKQQSRSRSRPRPGDGFDLLVASHSAELGGLLKIWRLDLAETSLKVTHPIAPYKTLTLQKPASLVAFNTAPYPKRRHSQLLITDFTGVARIYDPFASPARKQQASSTPQEPGAYTSTLRSTFEGVKSNAYTPEVLASRKAIIDAAWTSDGHHILALLADGEWGVWDVDRSGPSPPADPSAFSLRGFVGTSEKEASTSGASSPKRSGRSSLAPMTPNTRRRKEDTLFHGSSSNSPVAIRGGISVASSSSTNGAALEDSVIIWYGSEVYKVADLAKFWARTASAASGSSLPSPGLQVQDVSLLGEAITSISQSHPTVQAPNMATTRDTLISAEYRLIITASTNQPLGRDLNAMFPLEQVKEEETRRTDQALLSRGELDLGGMDRLLEDMEGSGTAAKSLTLTGGPRKVLFASSAA